MESITEKIARIIKRAVRMRIKPMKRRSPTQRLRSRLYYRKNRSKIRLKRRQYMRKYRSVLKNRKQFLRYKPSWFKKTKKPHHAPKPHKFKVIAPKFKRVRMAPPGVPRRKRH